MIASQAGLKVRSWSLLALVALWICAPARAEDAAGGQGGSAQPNAASVPDLIRQLGSPEFERRQNAIQALRGMGDEIRDQLEAATKVEDVEVAHEALMLLKSINRARLILRVQDPEGKPVSNAQVIVALNRKVANVPTCQSLTGTTDESGSISFGNLDPDKYVINLSFRAEGFIPGYENNQNRTLEVGKNEKVLHSRRGCIIKGVLRYTDGTPLANARVTVANSSFLNVRIQDRRPMLLQCPTATSDASGAFAIRDLSDQRYFVSVLGENKVLYSGPLVSVKDDQTLDLGDVATGIAPPSHAAPAPVAPAGDAVPPKAPQ